MWLLKAFYWEAITQSQKVNRAALEEGNQSFIAGSALQGLKVGLLAHLKNCALAKERSHLRKRGPQVL